MNATGTQPRPHGAAADTDTGGASVPSPIEATPAAIATSPPGLPTAGAHTALPAPDAARLKPRPRPVETSDSVHPDPRLVYARTEIGLLAMRNRSASLSGPAQRMLVLFDGERPLSHLPNVVRPGDLPMLLKELEAEGMITLAGVWNDDPAESSVHPDLKLAEIKRALAGVFEQELGPQASVLEARIQDCVNLVVLRNVLREVISLVASRKNDAAADRVAAIVREHGPF